MAIPSIYAPVKHQDFTLTPFPVNKRYTIDNTQLTTTESGFFLVDAVHTTLKTPIGSNKALNDPTNSIDGSYQHIRWQSLNRMYYKFPYDAHATFEHSNKRYTYKFLNASASHLSIPYAKMGEAVKAGSVTITNSTHNITLIDDLNGNLYDSSISTGSFTKRYAVVGYWGFNEAFKKFDYFEGSEEKGTIGYTSTVFEVDGHSITRNIAYNSGVPISGTGSGMCAEFSGQSYIMTHDKPDFNFASNEDFTLAFWIKAPVSQSNVAKTTNSLLSKRGTIQKLVYGNESKYNANDLIVNTYIVSSSVTDESTDVFPFDVDLYNYTAGSNIGKVRFRRSDGLNTLSLTSTSSIVDGNYHHVGIIKSNTTISLYVDGVLHVTGSDSTTHPINNHSVMFGSKNMSLDEAYSGSLDEIRIYDYAVPAAGIATLANNTNNSMYQTAVVGNVFYRLGNIVVSGFDNKYKDVFRNSWSATWKSTHTVYQYECLCRIKKGSFNLSMNPTARISPKSDLLINEMTGSSLLPYATGIGLYNDSGDLLAVAKLGQPLQMRDDVDLNVLIRWDS